MASNQLSRDKASGSPTCHLRSVLLYWVLDLLNNSL
jgi:hypothetical protein